MFVETVAGKGYRFVADANEVGASSGTPSTRVTVGVLPFENLSVDPEREYLADGLTDETIAVLGQVDPQHIGAIGRTSVKAYKRTMKTLADIGRELSADYLVEGSLAEGARCGSRQSSSACGTRCRSGRRPTTASRAACSRSRAS